MQAIPIRTIVCELGFLKQNWIKSKKIQFNLKTLNALMKASLNGLEVDAMEKNAIYDNRKVDSKSKK